jgi:DNA-binding NtrC family response regulator
VSVAGARLLVVEDNETLRRGVCMALGEAGHQVDAASRGDAAVAKLSDASGPVYDVVITDLRLPGADGLAVLRAARERESRSAVIVMTAFGSVETAVDAMREGAFDFVQKPLGLDQLEVRVARAVEHTRLLREVRDLRAERAERLGREKIVGTSAALQEAVDLASRAAVSRATVLISGETGTGKELIAGLVHAGSPRAGAAFVKVNCAALPETLLESELFGHERGAFTGADRTRVGRFEQADGGTLFLDEVGDMSPATQAKVLRVLQEHEFSRLGATQTLKSDVRIVAATNHELDVAIAEGRFREDLYFRLNVIGVHLPPLRERGDDVTILAAHLEQEFSRELGRPSRRFTRAAENKLSSHGWPGNVRELRNVIERATLLAEGERIDAEDLILTPVSTPHDPGREIGLSGFTLAEVEREVVLAALRRSGFVQKTAAGLLGVSRRKLNYMIQKMGITHPAWRRNRADADSETVDPDGLGSLDSVSDAS